MVYILKYRPNGKGITSQSRERKHKINNGQIFFSVQLIVYLTLHLEWNEFQMKIE